MKENIHFNQHPVSSYALQSGYLWCRIILLPCQGSRTITPRTITPRTITPGQLPPGQLPPLGQIPPGQLPPPQITEFPKHKSTKFTSHKVYKSQSLQVTKSTQITGTKSQYIRVQILQNTSKYKGSAWLWQTLVIWWLLKKPFWGGIKPKT